MPPKKKQKVTATIHSDLLTALDTHKPSALTADALPPSLLSRAYGLVSPYKDTQGAENLNRICTNRWSSTDDAPEGSKDVKGKGKARQSDTAADEVDVLDLTRDDVGPSTSKGKAKGKSKTVDLDAKARACSSENCDRNPRCLNWLGQDKWENDAQALKDFRKASGLGIDPENDREDGLPVGLQNLGATCYANSFLQVWYRDLRFRSGVYSCLPSANGNVEASPIFQLQVLFAFLQTSIQGVYDPSPLIQSLKLDTSEQQDAQEFSKLFLQVLDREFKKQGSRAEQEGADGSVARLVEEHFEGKMAFFTQCTECGTKSERPSTFLELEVNLEKNCKLEDRIKDSLKPETLSGDNQYFCEVCDQKQDAMRGSRLADLPPVLHFSLIRFVWDMEDLSRRKSNDLISYPLSLDMGQFLPKPEGAKKRDEVWYDLKGVLTHKGTSAHHGHYVAQVYDESQGKWFLFDDETVSPIDDLNAPTVHDDDGEAVKSKKKPAAGFTRDANGGILPRSKDAYMLVYTRRDSPASSPAPSSSSRTSPAVATAAPAEMDPPALAKAAVEKLDELYQQEMAEYKMKADGIEDEFKAAREKKRSVYRVWDVQEDDEESFLIDKNELRRWMLDGLKKPKPKKKGKEVEQEKPRPKEDGATSDLEIVEPKDEKPGRAVKDDDVEMADGDAPSPAAAKLSGDPDDLPHPSTLAAVSSPSEDAAPIKVLDNSAITCEHGMLNPRKAETMKRVSQMGLTALQELGVSVEPELRAPRDFCRECVAGIAADHVYEKKHPKDVDSFDKADKVGLDRKHLISKDWLRDWRKTKPKMHRPGTSVDPSPGDEPYLSDVACEHGRTQPDAKRRTGVTDDGLRVLQRVFKGWEPHVGESCEICEGKLVSDQGDWERQKQVLRKEKKLLKAFDGLDQGRLTGNRLPISADDHGHYAIPKVWCHAWNAWVKGGARGPNSKTRPGHVDNSIYLCKHDLLCFDLRREVEGNRSVVVVPPKEWQYLEKHYDAGPPIRIWQELSLDAPSSSPEVCEECFEEQRKTFATAELQIRVLSSGDFDEAGNRKPDSPVTENPPADKGMFGPLAQYGSRKSSRIKNKSHVAFQKELYHIEMAKEDLVKDLKLKIEQQTRIPVITQRLFYNFQELQDASVSVAELGLGNTDTLEVFGVDTNEVDLSKLEDAKPSSRKRGRSEGFGGTGLLGWEDFVEGAAEPGEGEMEFDDAPPPSTNGHSNGNGSSSSSSVTVTAPTSDDGVPCPTCTFLNAAGMQTCEVCEKPLAG